MKMRSIGKALGIAALAAVLIAGLGSAQTGAPQRGRSVITRPMAKRGFLGVGVVAVTEERAKALKLSDQSGVEVKHIDANSPAEKAGVHENDVIFEVDGQKIENVEQFIQRIGEAAPGTKVNLTVWRAGAKQNLTATLEMRPLLTFNGPDGFPQMAVPVPAPDVMPMIGQTPVVGFEGETLTPQLAEFFGVKEGVLVRTVVEHTPAAKAGLKAGDVVIKVSGTPVASTREISGIVHAVRHNLTFTIVRNHKEMTLNIEIANEAPLTSSRPEPL
jgi:serine protease Do